MDICPLFDKDTSQELSKPVCVENECTWWDCWKRQCSICSIRDYLKEIYENK